MDEKRLFNDDETYNDVGRKLCIESEEMVAKLLQKYKDYPTQDVLVIMFSALNYQACMARLERQVKASRALVKGLRDKK